MRVGSDTGPKGVNAFVNNNIFKILSQIILILVCMGLINSYTIAWATRRFRKAFATKHYE